MRISQFSFAFVSLMHDTMNIYRYTHSQNEDGTTSTKLPKTPLYENVKCRISFSSKDNPKDSEVDETPIKYSPKLFCPADTDIIAGDVIKINRMQDDGSILTVYEGTAGQPAMYPTHKELYFYVKESA